MNLYQPKPNEVVFPVWPIGVKYVCEYCHEGEMRVVNEPVNVLSEFETPMIKHICTNCNKEMILPKTYPYIEWAIVEEEEAKQNWMSFLNDQYQYERLGDNNSDEKLEEK